MHRMMLTIPAVLTEAEQAIHDRFGDWPRRVAPAPESDLIDYPEAAQKLGITVNALQKRVARNLIPGIVRTGTRVQFSRQGLAAYITNKRSR
jgi:predicted DNA-binding transcriptional regulator AlpA